jgi:small conductance mechanosensitive channel
MFNIAQLTPIEQLITVGAIAMITVIIERIVRKILHNHLEGTAKHMRVDPTQYAFFKHIIGAVIYLIGIGLAIYVVPSLRALSVSLFAGAGILAVVVGFASQQALGNVVSGIFIALFKPFRVGDKVKIKDNVQGYVEDITLRHTIIRDFQNQRVIIPNSVISNEIIENAHFGDEKICKHINIGISYDADIDKAFNIMKHEALRHPLLLDNRTKKQKEEKKEVVVTHVVSFSDSSVNIRAWVWAKNPSDAWDIQCDLNKAIKEAFDKEGIEIPYPYRTIVYKKDISKKRKKVYREKIAKKIGKKQ